MTDIKLLKYEDYLADSTLLKKHKDSLINSKITLGQNIFSDFQHIESKFEIISKPQTILKFSKKASEMGWRNLELMSKKAFDVCEKDGALLNDCLTDIKKIQDFSDASNLSDEHKDAVYRELEYYKDQQITLVTFSKDFKEKFNDKIALFNSKSLKIENIPSTLSEKKIESNKGNLLGNLDNITPYLGMSLVVISLAFLVRHILFSKIKKRTILEFFNIQKVTKFRVRLFGEVTQKNVNVLNNVGQKLSRLFKIKHSALYGELKIIFSTKKEYSKVELKMTGNESSFHSFYKGHTGEFSDTFKIIVSDLEKEGHEIAISTQFSSDGKIQSSRLIIYSSN